MEDESLGYFKDIEEKIKTEDNHVKKEYGRVSVIDFWKIEMWLYEEVVYQLLDKGITARILTVDIIVERKGETELTYIKGGEEELKELREKICK